MSIFNSRIGIAVVIRPFTFALTIGAGISTFPASAQERYATAIQRVRDLANLYCGSEVYDEPACRNVIKQARALERANPGHYEATEVLAGSLWNASFHSSPPARQLRERQESLARYRQLVKQQPKNGQLKLDLSSRTPDADERFRLLQEASLLKDTPAEVHGDLASELLARNRIEAAYQQSALFLSSLQEPERADLMWGVAFALDLTSHGRRDLSLTMLKDLMQRSKSLIPFEQCLPFQSIKTQDYPELASELRRLAPQCTNLQHRNEAVRLEMEGRLPEAAREMQLQIESNPEYAEAYSILQDMYQRNHQPEEGAKLPERFLSAQPGGAAGVCQAVTSGNNREIGMISPTFVEGLRQACVRRGYSK